MMRKLFFAGFCCAVAVTAAAAPGDLLALNGDFETVEDGKLPGWTSFRVMAKNTDGRIEPSGDLPHGGKYAGRFRNAERASWIVDNAAFAVSPGERYTCALMIRNRGGKPVDFNLQLLPYGDGKGLSHDTRTLWLRDISPEWTRYSQTFVVPAGADRMLLRIHGYGAIDFELDDLKIKLAGRGETPVPVAPVALKAYTPVEGGAGVPGREKLGRSLVALKVGEGVYLSWRLLAEDPGDVAFDLFRMIDGKETKVNDRPLRQTTDFTDCAPGGAKRYTVRPAAGFSGISGEAAVLAPNRGNPYRSYRISESEARPDKAGFGDLDGDGEYDVVIRVGAGGTDPVGYAWSPSKRTYRLEAFRHDGTPLWSRDMTWSIEHGNWYCPYLLYDLDGDGRAEVILKTGEGDCRDADGRVTSGPEYLAVLDGLTGREIARTPWPDRYGMENYNNASRNQLAIAYLDGKTPCVIVERGTYSTIKVEAFALKNRKLESLWRYDTRAYGNEYRGQGAHSIRVADLDGDGRDEIVIGSTALDDDGRPLWSTGMGHPDYIFISDISKANPGQEVVSILERRAPNGGGITVADGKTGKVVWKLTAPTYHVHHGYAGDLDARYPGFEIGGIDTAAGLDRKKLGRWVFRGDGELLYTGDAVPEQTAVQTLFWDGDLQREVAAGMPRKFGGGPVGGVIEGAILTTADLSGDWREELVTSLNGELRVYSTTIPAMDRRVTLMQDHQYRLAAATASSGYELDPVLSYLPTGKSPNLSLMLLGKGVWRTLRVTVGAPLDQSVRGRLTFVLPGAEVPARPLELAPGAIETFEIPVTLDGGKEPVRAEFALDNGVVLRGETATMVEPLDAVIPRAGAVAEAEAFVAEHGGRVRERADRPGVSGLSLSNWDDAGHELTWVVVLPTAGKYRLDLRYAWPRETGRRVFVNGRDLGEFRLPPTGGNGETAGDWQIFTLSRDGKALELELPKGSQTIKIRNEKGEPMNFDHLVLQRIL